jgi:hypothetical protein
LVLSAKTPPDRGLPVDRDRIRVVRMTGTVQPAQHAYKHEVGESEGRSEDHAGRVIGGDVEVGWSVIRRSKAVTWFSATTAHERVNDGEIDPLAAGADSDHGRNTETVRSVLNVAAACSAR